MVKIQRRFVFLCAEANALGSKPSSIASSSSLVGTVTGSFYIEVYAYVLSKTITYSIDGEQAGSFDMKCYYEYVKTLGNDNLTALVERFARYCESAESYRLSVTEN